jgi:hypothetical protein
VNEREDGTNINGWHWEVRARDERTTTTNDGDDVFDARRRCAGERRLEKDTMIGARDVRER